MNEGQRDKSSSRLKDKNTYPITKVFSLSTSATAKLLPATAVVQSKANLEAAAAAHASLSQDELLLRLFLLHTLTHSLPEK
jgi:hypothetical protein